MIDPSNNLKTENDVKDSLIDVLDFQKILIGSRNHDFLPHAQTTNTGVHNRSKTPFI